MPMFMHLYRRKKYIYVDIAVIQIAGAAKRKKYLLILKKEQSRMNVIE